MNSSEKSLSEIKVLMRNFAQSKDEETYKSIEADLLKLGDAVMPYAVEEATTYN